MEKKSQNLLQKSAAPLDPTTYKYCSAN